MFGKQKPERRSIPRNSHKRSNWDILLSPWMVFSGIIGGILVGVFYKSFAGKISFIGEIYLALLQMCILPILITAILSSIGRLLTSADTGKYVGKLLVTFILGLCIASLIGIIVGTLGQPGSNLDKSVQMTLGKKISETEMQSQNDTTTQQPSSGSFTTMLRKMIPTNVFAATSQGHNLSVLFFSIIVGIALGLVRSSASNATLSVIDGLYDAFIKLIGWLMYGLPFGLFSLFAVQISQVGYEMITAMLKLVVYVYLSSMILIGLYSLIIFFRVGGPFLRIMSIMRETLIVAMGTSNGYAAIPSAIRGLHNGLKLDKDTTNLVIPLGISLNPQGSVMHFAISTMFMVQLYNKEVNLNVFFIILLSSLLAGLAATGVPGLAALGMIALVLEPLGLPVGVAVILLAAIDPILNPILTVVNVYANCASTAVVATIERTS